MTLGCVGFGLTHSGASYSAEELEALAEVFRKYRVLVLADEIYGPIQFEYEYRSLTEFYPEVCCVCVCVLVLVCSAAVELLYHDARPIVSAGHYSAVWH